MKKSKILKKGIAVMALFYILIVAALISVAGEQGEVIGEGFG